MLLLSFTHLYSLYSDETATGSRLQRPAVETDFWVQYSNSGRTWAEPVTARSRDEVESQLR